MTLRERIEGLVARLRSTKGHLAAVVLANDTADALAAALAAEGQGEEPRVLAERITNVLADGHWLNNVTSTGTIEIIKLIESVLAVAPSLHKEETGWLIERAGPMWMFIRDDHQTSWTTDSLKAVRFARREDAEGILFALGLQGVMEACVTEHRWGL